MSRNPNFEFSKMTLDLNQTYIYESDETQSQGSSEDDYQHILVPRFKVSHADIPIKIELS